MSPETHSERLSAESFTKGVYTVPGYSAKEDKDSSDPPFEPSPGTYYINEPDIIPDSQYFSRTSFNIFFIECGGKYLNLTEGTFGFITSPNYPNNYPSSKLNLTNNHVMGFHVKLFKKLGSQCEWIIEVCKNFSNFYQ